MINKYAKYYTYVGSVLVVVQWAGRERDGVFKERFGCQASKENGRVWEG